MSGLNAYGLEGCSRVFDDHILCEKSAFAPNDLEFNRSLWIQFIRITTVPSAIEIHVFKFHPTLGSSEGS